MLEFVELSSLPLPLPRLPRVMLNSALRQYDYQPLSLSVNADPGADTDAALHHHTGFCSSSRLLLLTRSRVLQPIRIFSYGIWSRCAEFVRANAGLLLVAASQGFFALMNVSVKKLNSLERPVPTLELIVVRMGITYICCLAYLLWRKVPDPFLGPKGVRHLLVIRGFSGFFGLFGIYYSLQYLSLSDATVLTFLAPLTTAVSGCLFLGEVFSRKEAAAGVLSLLGVVLIARPEAIFGAHSAASIGADSGVLRKVTPGQRLGAVGVALVGVLGATGAYTSMRAIGKRAHTLHSMSYFSLWCVITSTVGMMALHQEFIFPTRLEWLALLIMIGIFGFLAQALLTMGLQRETAGRGALAIYVQIIFATIFERVFFHTTSSALSIIGTLIIMGSAVYVAITKKSSQSSTSSARKSGHADNDNEARDGNGSNNDNESDGSGVAAFDLELGVAEPETQMSRPFGHHDNTSRIFFTGLGQREGQSQSQSQSQKKGSQNPVLAPGTGIGIGLGSRSSGLGMGQYNKSEVSLHVPTQTQTQTETQTPFLGVLKYEHEGPKSEGEGEGIKKVGNGDENRDVFDDVGEVEAEFNGSDDEHDDDRRYLLPKA